MLQGKIFSSETRYLILLKQRLKNQENKEYFKQQYEDNKNKRHDYYAKHNEKIEQLKQLANNENIPYYPQKGYEIRRKFISCIFHESKGCHNTQCVDCVNFKPEKYCKDNAKNLVENILN